MNKNLWLIFFQKVANSMKELKVLARVDFWLKALGVKTMLIWN